MFRIDMSGFLEGIYSAFLNHYNCKYITSCEHDELTGPPTDPDGNPLEYFDRTEKLSGHSRNWFWMINGYYQ